MISLFRLPQILRSLIRINDLMKLPFGVLFHPAETFRLLKLYRNKFSYLPVIIILFLIIVVRVAYIYIVHFPLAAIEPVDANILLEIVRFLVPILTWVIASYAVTAILGGEALMREILLAAAYSVVPYILTMIPIALFSLVLSQHEAGIYNFLISVVWVWIGLLFFISVRTLHGYTIGKTIWIIILILITMFLIWAVLILTYALAGNLRAFLVGFIRELWMQLFRSGGRI